MLIRRRAVRTIDAVEHHLFTKHVLHHIYGCVNVITGLIYSAGCDLVFFLAAFHISIGPQYWELLNRARAVDNQLFVADLSPARNEQANYVVYGHSMIINPTGNILTQAGIKEGIICLELGAIQQNFLHQQEQMTA